MTPSPIEPTPTPPSSSSRTDGGEPTSERWRCDRRATRVRSPINRAHATTALPAVYIKKAEDAAAGTSHQPYLNLQTLYPYRSGRRAALRTLEKREVELERLVVVMVGAEGKSMLGEAAEKLGFKGREDRGVGAQTTAADAGATAKEDGPPVVATLKNRAGESRSPYVSCSRRRWRMGMGRC